MIKRGINLKVTTIFVISLFAYMPLNAEITGDIEYGKKLAEEAPSPLILQILLYKYLD